MTGSRRKRSGIARREKRSEGKREATGEQPDELPREAEHAGEQADEQPREGRQRAGAERRGRQRASAERRGRQRASADQPGEQPGEQPREGRQRASADEPGEQPGDQPREGRQPESADQPGEQPGEQPREGRQRAGAERRGQQRAGAERRGRRERRQQARTQRREGRQQRRGERAEKGERRRRSPEVARQELLDAAERVFIEFAPDQVGLKEIGREAGVSHALVTHYFGTYQGLIEAALRRRLVALRETMVARVREAGVLSRPEELLAMLFRAFEDPVHLRLMKWLVSTERPTAMHMLALQEQGLQIVAHQVASALRVNPSRELVERVELALMTSVAAALGYAVGKYALAGAAGKQVGVKLDEAVHTTLAGMLRTYLAAQIAAEPPEHASSAGA